MLFKGERLMGTTPELPALDNVGAASRMSRRGFLKGAGAVTVAALAAEGHAVTAAAPAAAQITKGGPSTNRHDAALRNRIAGANMAAARPNPPVGRNGDEDSYGGTRIGNYTKGLPHNNLGEVQPAAYAALLRALASGLNADFEAVPLGGVRPQRNPQSGLAFDLEGPDAQSLAMRPPPRTDSAEQAGEAAELYWMALARDVAFTDYSSDPTVAAAAADLSNFSDFRGLKQVNSVTPATVFRGNTPGDLNGPYLSQFLLSDVPYGSLTINHRQQTLAPNVDYMTTYPSWLSIQNGAAPSASDAFDGTRRYIRNGRDLAQYVHVDALYEAYLNACLFLLATGAPFDAGNPYNGSTKQDAFGTFGGPHILSLVTEVASRALKAVWYAKYFVHRRSRPEAFGGVVHNRVTGAANYPVHSELLNSPVLARTFARTGTYLLPQAFPEGSPLHPSYGSGHATVGGACATILKAWFNESATISNPVVASNDGTSLVSYSGPPLTVGGELNKVVANIASGRNFAGIHWRTDFSEGAKLGEAVAIGILQEQMACYNERGSFTLTKFDGTTITI